MKHWQYDLIAASILLGLPMLAWKALSLLIRWSIPEAYERRDWELAAAIIAWGPVFYLAVYLVQTLQKSLKTYRSDLSPSDRFGKR